MYNKYRIKMYDDNRTEATREEIEVYCCKSFLIICEVLLNHLKVHCDTLKLYTINSKANTKIIQL